MFRSALLLILAVISAPSAVACEFVDGEVVEAEDAIDGESLRLKDGREVRLIGIRAPRPAIAKAAAEPFFVQARAALSQWAKGKRVKLHYAGVKRVDRYDRVLANVTREDGVWLQARMVESGLGRVHSDRDNRACVSDLLFLERTARQAKRGLWVSSYYGVRRADDLERLVRLDGTYQLVEGRIRSIASVQKRIYINFGDDWRTDFTVTVPPAVARLFLKGDASVPAAERIEAFRQAWKDKQVRIRGWLGNYNGPEMQMTHPEQMELLEAASDASDIHVR